MAASRQLLETGSSWLPAIETEAGGEALRLFLIHFEDSGRSPRLTCPHSRPLSPPPHPVRASTARSTANPFAGPRRGRGDEHRRVAGAADALGPVGQRAQAAVERPAIRRERRSFTCRAPPRPGRKEVALARLNSAEQSSATSSTTGPQYTATGSSATSFDYTKWYGGNRSISNVTWGSKGVHRSSPASR